MWIDIRTVGRLALAAAFVLLTIAARAQGAPAYPFGSHKQAYAAGSLKPTIVQSAVDVQTAAFYDKYKASYLKPGCGAGQYYVKADTDAGAMVVSEGQGYGMLIVAMMAGHDPQARTIFDGLHRYNLAHPSGIDPWLTSWTQGKQCQNIVSNDSATDGDLDIAYALLLAHKQWGSAGEFNYLIAAKRVIAALKRKNVNSVTKLINLGDWVPTASAKYRYASRSSDWMPDHFRAFARRVDAATWTPVLAAHLAVIKQMQDDYAAATGLLPDFAVNTSTAPKPAPAGFLEGANDGRYNYNACRDPWRIGLDAAISGDARSKAATRRISQWARTKYANRTTSIRDGYTLAGGALVEYQTMSFVAPFAVAAISDPGAQVWLDALWSAMVRAAPDGYYPDSIKLLSMLAVSRNWLTP